jgi:hypothetical protein
MSPRSLRRELLEETAHGDVYLRRLRRTQLSLTLLSLVSFGGLIGALPLLLVLAPGLQHATAVGVPLPIVLLVLPPFPLFVLLGWVHARRAKAIDDEFRELVERG